MSDDIQVKLIKDGRCESQCSEVVSPTFATDYESRKWTAANNTMFADRIELWRDGHLRSVGRRTTSGGYAWAAVPFPR